MFHLQEDIFIQLSQVLNSEFSSIFIHTLLKHYLYESKIKMVKPAYTPDFIIFVIILLN